jgi:hypothetical protein
LYHREIMSRLQNLDESHPHPRSIFQFANLI